MDLLKPVSFDTVLTASNIATSMDEDDCAKIGEMILMNYRMDVTSRAQWEDRYAVAMKLAMQLMEERSFPWPNASNAKFPLLTISALQYHARAYPALVRGTMPVSARVWGEDPDGQKQARAKRISGHMSFQVLEEDTQWEESYDKTLIVQAILGCAFRKTYFDGAVNHIVSELVLPSDLVINYWAKSLETAPRFTHVIHLYPNEIEERIRRGLFIEKPFKTADDDYQRGAPPAVTVISAATDEIEGTQPNGTDQDTPIRILEQHLYLDLDGDGYREPVIGWVREDTGALLRLVGRFENDRVERNKAGQIVRITPEQYFTKVPFIPSPDGSIYDMGFGMLLGATNEVINTLLNQLIDAGTMSNLGGGFLARTIKMRGGDYSFKPNEWKRTDSTGDELQKGVYALPVREPSATLFNLLNLMIDFGQRIGMATDALTGENPGQNQKVGTTDAVIEQGEKVFNGVYKRTYRALKNEFRLIYRLNYLNPPPDGVFKYASDDPKTGGVAYWKDYFDTDKTVTPAADPNIASRELLAKRDMTVLQLGGTVPGINMYEATRRVLEDMEVPAIDAVLTPPEKQQPPGPPKEVQIAQIKADADNRSTDSKLLIHREKIQVSRDEAQAKIILMQSQAALASAQAGLSEANRFSTLLDSELASAQQERDAMDAVLKHIDTLTQQGQQQETQNGNDDAAGLGGVGGAPADQGVPADAQGGGV